MLLRLTKFWQTKNLQLVWAVASNQENLPKRFYLILDANQNGRRAYFSLEKPSAIDPSAAGATLVRKHAKASSLLDISEDPQTRNLWISLSVTGKTQGADWYILLEWAKPPTIHFISSSRENLFRINSKGTYTKKQTAETAGPANDSVSLLKSLLGALITSQEDDDEVEQAALPTLPTEQRKIASQLKRRIKTLKKSLERQEKFLPSEQEVRALEESASMLKSFSHLAKPEAFEVTIPEEVSGKPTRSISLDPDMSIGENIDAMYVHAKKLKRGLLKAPVQIEKIARDLEDAQSDYARLKESILDEGDLIRIRKRYKISPSANTGKSKQAVSLPYRKYISQGMDILVGKGAKENDVLTKAAKGSDFWIHAVGVTGSHVIVKCGKYKGQALPESVFRDAAILALHNSKIRGDLGGEVYYTRRQNIKKQKGMPPGLWNVEHSKSVLVKYNQEDLQKILDQVAERS